MSLCSVAILLRNGEVIGRKTRSSLLNLCPISWLYQSNLTDALEEWQVLFRFWFELIAYLCYSLEECFVRSRADDLSFGIFE